MCPTKSARIARGISFPAHFVLSATARARFISTCAAATFPDLDRFGAETCPIMLRHRVEWAFVPATELGAIWNATRLGHSLRSARGALAQPRGCEASIGHDAENPKNLLVHLKNHFLRS